MVTLWCFSRRRRVYFKLVVIIIFGLFIYILYKTSRTQQYLTNQESLNSFESNQIKPRASPIKEILPRQEKLPLKQTNVPPKKTAVIYLDDKLDNLMSITPGLGEKGQPVILNKEEQKEADKLFKQAAFNVYISNRIALNRSVPDPRNSECHKVEYDSDLPQTSVIIIFTNEIWSALLRTIHSVINRTPKHLLKEIILVDDFSDKDHLKKPLENYVKTRLPPGLVSIVRMGKRQGLIRARLAGARKATGDVLIFLDSHCEANKQWVEPLLQGIKRNRKAVLCPIIDVIDDNTLEYYSNNGDYFQVGGFTWNGHFNWIEISPSEETRRGGSPIAPARTPTMAGGLFAIERNYFWEVGSYDDGMDIWGGENLEMSFRVWMCGGQLEIVPCSHVGHIFRNYHPYTFPGNKDTHGINTVRTAEVWMDEYKEYFYLHRPDLKGIDFGDISSRLKLKKDLSCKSFDWYLSEIYPQKFIPNRDAVGFGTVRNPISKLCMDTLNANEDKAADLGLYPCSEGQGSTLNQMFSLMKTGQLRREETCLEAHRDPNLPVQLTKCVDDKPEQLFSHSKGGPIVHKPTGLCLEAIKKKPYDSVHANHCNGGFAQVWWFENYPDIQLDISFHPNL